MTSFDTLQRCWEDSSISRRRLLLKRFSKHFLGEVFGYMMLVINMLCPLPQIYKTIKTKNVEDLNTLSSLLAILGDSLYLGSILLKPESKLTRVYFYSMLPWGMQAAS